jgi:hypothetical protein
MYRLIPGHLTDLLRLLQAYILGNDTPGRYPLHGGNGQVYNAERKSSKAFDLPGVPSPRVLAG